MAEKSSASSELAHLQTTWKTLYQNSLPLAAAARNKSPSQAKWPVHNDHCFARIILDNSIGINTPWMEKVKSPAWKNMSVKQLEDAIALGERILQGKEDLVGLDGWSLGLRGKRRRDVVGGGEEEGNLKRKKRKMKGEEEIEIPPDPEKGGRSHQDELSKYFPPAAASPQKRISEPAPSPAPIKDHTPYLKKIALSTSLSPYQKRVLTALCQVPCGRFTTYGLLSKYLSSSPRAVGNGLRNNPFAPQVPCHRVLASGGGLGGFKGSWGRGGKEGLNDDEKKALLRAEGVRFDGRGIVIGRPWDEFI